MTKFVVFAGIGDQRYMPGSVTQFLEERMNPDDGSKYYQCGLCSQTALFKGNLKRHLILKHAKPSVDICQYCGKKFKNKLYKDYHLRNKTCLRDVLFDPV